MVLSYSGLELLKFLMGLRVRCKRELTFALSSASLDTLEADFLR